MNNERFKKLPRQRWKILSSDNQKIGQFVKGLGISPIIAQVLLNRGIDTLEAAKIYIDPELENLPPPLQEFAPLRESVQLLKEAIVAGKKIAICGDYDADGMTSTALLLRALKHLEADVSYAIPSRMKDGYGINQRIVKEFAEEGISLILTVDNGISAYEPVVLAKDLGLNIIITDHHDIPEQIPPADAILNPKLLPESSPYRGLAGVGVAYILAVSVAQGLNKLKGLTEQLIELFTLGTIADLAPLVGVNRRWLKRGLKRLPKSQLLGVQSLIQLSGVNDEQKQLHPDDIGFKLGPRINAIGRIGDPQIAIELLTTEDAGIALERAMQCEVTNKRRQDLCQQIEQEAIALIEETPINWQEDRVLLLVKDNWHHGVIGIVASRLVERYGVPVFIATYEEDDPCKARGSARGIDEFHVFKALEYSQDLLGKFGGHKKAGGFGLTTENLPLFKERLREFAHQYLEPEHLKPLVKIDAQIRLNQIDTNLYQAIENLQPWGIENDVPVFWTPQVRIIEQSVVGKNHIKMIVGDGSSTKRAIAWRWAEYCPLPTPLDIAYKLRKNTWNGEENIELEIVGVRNYSQI
jgi:single-stranded-DNA-specific exonuclease